MSSLLPPGRLARLADLAFRRRRAVVAAWVAGLVAAFAAAGLAGDWSADYSTPGSESRAAAELLEERFPQRSPGDRRRRLAGARSGAGAQAVARADRPARAAARGSRASARGAPPRRGDLARRHDRRAARIPLTELPGAIPTRPASADRARRARERRRGCASSSAAS